MIKKPTINFITSNIGKVREFKQILEPEIKVNHIRMSYHEIRSDDPEEIARHSAKELAEKLKKKVVVSMDEKPRKLDGIDILPVSHFLEMLWGDEII